MSRQHIYDSCGTDDCPACREIDEAGAAPPADFLMVAKLRDLLYEAIVELSYVQETEDHSQCASAKGAAIVNKGMELLGIKDLSAEHLPIRRPRDE